jgi:hypothetical protein
MNCIDSLLPIGPRTPLACSFESSFEHASSLLSLEDLFLLLLVNYDLVVIMQLS